ncbi:MAG TPA: LLM class F420-dependent oxidoreductase [Chloroflexota bacterium]|nr:LLM class F420-dependent oxidoreductase [Chloroflexota bacterium]
MDLGKIGVWSGALRNGERGAVLDAAAELEDLGYGTIWFPGGAHEGLTEHIESILQRTRRVGVATGIVNIWTHPAAEVAAEHHAITTAHPGRFLLGLGVSHQPVVERSGLTYQRPLAKMTAYLDALDAAPHPVPKAERILASLGPKSLAQAGARACGTHPYFVPPAHTRLAREALGPLAVVAPEQMVVLETDQARAREIARPLIDRYLHAPNYTNNLLRLGFTAADFSDGGSDHLVDAIVAHGDADTVMRRVQEHLDAGADHVCIQVLTPTPAAIPMDGWRQLARVLPH